ncbi:MAG: DNA gyrase subunit A [Deltaproteobacteria bacterium]|nr:DNA gyrase subunit A [Deltaproteobacteria bacterium]MBW2211482.1 DNA gyrase subunit A [Deltaproteobacteria bacterium]MBW2377951.1 DNA gyrase subunit A [Deltaproteobacteria bacterium]MBW2551216.1 DNA gyrase subunit A [Deltaproteobacteria bacterium]MBW2629062.1 DNA gyrase subunit A [Deltaproteobacteria bacterium]
MAESSQKQPVALEDEMRRSYLDYAMSVIIGRAIPDVRDGLKPVHRRILYSMHEQKVHWNGSYRKSARIVGDVLGKYHPHGDSAVYDALVRMAQHFSMRYPLVDGQGNFGSVDGDPAAAMRYTEVRMSRLASELLADIEKETVRFGPNFDDSESEPLVLPSRIPNLLINGSGGIAVGMATNIPPHNLREVVDATVRLMGDPELTVDQLMQDDDDTGRLGVKGPDFPTAGYIYGKAGIHLGYRTGRGRIVMRARATIEEMRGKGDREMIVITEIPYQVNKAELLKKVADLVRDKRLEGISDIRDESDRDGLRVVIELKRDAHGEIVLNKLYQMTALQSTFGYNCLAIVGQRPEVLDLRSVLLRFIEHRREVVVRRTRYDLRQAKAQRELIEGLGMAVTDVDLVVSTIRSSKDADEARGRLMKLALNGLEEFVKRAGRPEAEIQVAKERGDYYLSERQAKAILEMRLSRLTGLEREKLATEYAALCELIGELDAILASKELLDEVIVTELDEIRERFGDARRTEIVEAEGDISIEDLVPDEEVVVTVSHAGYVKRVPLSEYRAQGRGGKGLRAMDTRDQDFVSWVFVVNAHADVLFLSDKGKAYIKKVYQIPETGRAARGRAVVNLVGMEPDERVAAILPIREFVEDGYLLTCTRRGRVKRTNLSAYENIRQTGIIGVAIGEGDGLLTARIVTAGQHVLIGTSHGMTIRFPIEDVRSMGRDSMGVKGIDLREGDFVIGMDIIEAEGDRQVLTVSANGYGKRTKVSDWRTQNRGGKGIIGMDTSERNGALVKLRLVSPEDQLMVITNGGQVIRTRVSEIRETGRNTQGVRVIRLREAEQVVDVEPVAEGEEGEEGEIPESQEPPAN